MTSIRILPIALCAVGCTIPTAPAPASPTPLPKARGESGATFGADVFYSDIDLGEVEVDGGLTGGGGSSSDTFKDDQAKRERIGVRIGGGLPAVRGVVQFFGEQFTLNDTRPTGLDTGGVGLAFPLEFDLFGFGGAIDGAPAIGKFGDDTRLILPYHVGVNWVSGDTSNVDLDYLNGEADLGLGLDLFGLRLAGGVAIDGIIGKLEAANDPQIDGVNVGGYAEAGYKHPDFPVFVQGRAFFGDLEGFLVAGGVEF